MLEKESKQALTLLGLFLAAIIARLGWEVGGNIWSWM